MIYMKIDPLTCPACGSSGYGAFIEHVRKDGEGTHEWFECIPCGRDFGYRKSGANSKTVHKTNRRAKP